MKHQCSIQVRPYECDVNNHVNNAVYLNYLEWGRYNYLLDHGIRYEALMESGLALFVTEVHLKYHRGARVEEQLTLETWSSKAGAASGVMSQEIRCGEELILSAEVSWACVNKKGRPTRVPFTIPIAVGD